MTSSASLDVAAEPTRSHVISVKLRDINQLFNSMDPSPFIEKDLDDKAEEFIVGWAREFPPGARLKLRVHLEQRPAGDPKELIRQAIHNDFAHRSQLNTLEFRAMRQADELVRPCLRYKCRVLAQPAESL